MPRPPSRVPAVTPSRPPSRSCAAAVAALARGRSSRGRCRHARRARGARHGRGAARRLSPRSPRGCPAGLGDWAGWRSGPQGPARRPARPRPRRARRPRPPARRRPVRRLFRGLGTGTFPRVRVGRSAAGAASAATAPRRGCRSGRGFPDAATLLLLDGRDELALPHPPGAADAQLGGHLLQLGQHLGGQAGAGATRTRLGRGTGGGVAGRSRCAWCVGEEFGGVAQLKGPSQGSGAGFIRPGVPDVLAIRRDRPGRAALCDLGRRWTVALLARGSSRSPQDGDEWMTTPRLLPPARCRGDSNAHVPVVAASRRATGCGPTGGNGFRETAALLTPRDVKHDAAMYG